jgi:HD-like signal output (HDOD) protein
MPPAADKLPLELRWRVRKIGRMDVILPISRGQILEAGRALPAAPQVLGGLSELLQDINADLEQIAGQISLDAALAARVIRISNSAVYGGGLRLASVDEAVNRVGFSEVLRLVGIATVAGLVDREVVCYRIAAERVRESLLMHALASESLGRCMGIDSHTAYTGGLLRALGLMVLDRLARDTLPVEEFFDPRRFPGGYVEWERATFGISHTEVTAMILDEWRFAPELVTAIHQHLLERKEDGNDRFSCLLNVAGTIAANSGLALPGELGHWILTPEKLAAAGLEEDDVRRASEEAHGHFLRQRAALY